MSHYINNNILLVGGPRKNTSTMLPFSGPNDFSFFRGVSHLFNIEIYGFFFSSSWKFLALLVLVNHFKNVLFF